MPKKTRTKQDEALDFETALAELEAVVARLERGDQPLEQALVEFEKGIRLARHCQERLKAAEQRVEILLKQDGRLETEPFEPGE